MLERASFVTLALPQRRAQTRPSAGQDDPRVASHRAAGLDVMEPLFDRLRDPAGLHAIPSRQVVLDLAQALAQLPCRAVAVAPPSVVEADPRKAINACRTNDQAAART